MIQRVAVVGAGVAGLTCAGALRRAGLAVTVFDKGRQPGGRLATRYTAVGAFDHGAPSFTAADAAFATEVARWAEAGHVAADPGRPGAWTGTPAMNSLPRALAAGLDLRAGTRVQALRRDERRWQLLDADGGALDPAGHDAVVVAVPAEQALALLAPATALAASLQAVHSEPGWAVMAAWAQPLPGPGSGALGPLCRRPDSTAPLGPLACALHDNPRPGRRREAPERWVLHATPYWSAHNVELDAAEVVRHLLDDCARRAGTALPTPLHASAHRWRYAEVTQALAAACGWDAALALGVCGDAWSAGEGRAGVERAWHSGRALADRLLAQAAVSAR
jgi:predicted NAD/FAD-dependent oxidoreductase